MSHLRLSAFLFAILAILTACNTASQPSGQPAAPPDTRAADEAAIRALDAEWVKAIASKDLAQATSYYADTAEMFTPNAPAATGKDAVQKLCAGMLALPGFALSFAPSKVEVARSGDLAYETGEYEMTVNDKKGKPKPSKPNTLSSGANSPAATGKLWSIRRRRPHCEPSSAGPDE